jgi:hypothetical protein
MRSVASSELLNRICEEIETVRGEMVALALELGFLHPDVQLCSRRLDQLLLHFYSLESAYRRSVPASALERLTR